MAHQSSVSVRQLAEVIGMLSATQLAVLPAPLHYRNRQFQKTEGLLHHLSYDMSWRPDPGALATDALGQPWTAFRGCGFVQAD